MANDLTITLADRFETTGVEGAAEVVAYDGFRYYATNGAAGRIDVFRAGVGPVGTLELADLPGYAGVTSVAAKNGLVAVAIDGGDVAGIPLRGFVAVFEAASGALLNYVQVGFLPDSLTFSADGAEIYVANEGEPTARGDAPGSISIITFPEDVDRLAAVTDVGFAAFDGQLDALRATGVRLFPGRAPSRDFEPEYVTVDPADGAILVTLQEANTVARIDRATLEVTLLPQGTVNHAELGNGIDASDRDGAIRIVNWPVQGLRMADAIATFQISGETYYATANEGDSRDEDESRVATLDLDPTAFPLADALQLPENIGRLTVSTIDGDVDGDGDFDQLFAFGSRSFTIYDAAGNVVFDSADQFERIIAAVAPERFNTDEPGVVGEEENRSDSKGPEPEAIAVGAVDGRMIAVIGLERDSGLMVYDVTDPANATFLTYIDGVAAGDISPEVIAFIPGENSPTGFAQIAVAYEVSGSTAVYDLSFTGVAVGEGEPDTGATFTLQLLHVTDQEASTQAVFDAPRLSAVINALEAQDVGADATLRLSSGDAILPGLFFQASAVVFGQAGVADMIIQNELGFDAIAFGNHEFDFGSGFIADLIDGTFDLDGMAATPEEALSYAFDGVPAYAGTDFPYLSANLDFSTEPSLAPLAVAGGGAPMARTVTSSVVIEAGGELIGVVGATTPTIDFISSPGLLGVLPADFNGDPTPEQIDALAAIIQAEVDALLDANPTLNKVILLAHMQQIAIEQALAARLVNVDVIVAGGSNTRLLDETDRLRVGDTVQGVYPIVVENAGGTDTLVVNTDGSYKYVGRLVIDFDADGNIIADSYDSAVSGAYATDAQGVADLGAEGLVDPEIQAVADLINAQIVATESNLFGFSDVYLAGLRPEVRQQETNLGNLTADANLAEARKTDQSVLVSIKNGGGIRDDIGEFFVPAGGSEFIRVPNSEILDANGAVVKPAGGISQNDVIGALRFNNDLSLLTLTGAQLRAVLEHSVAASTYDAAGGVNQQGRFPQIAGVTFSFDPDLPAGSRIVSAAVFNDDGTLAVDLVRNGETVSPDATIRVVTLGFLAGGGDGYPFPQGPDADRVDLLQSNVRTGAATFVDDGTEQDALAEYLAANFLTTPYAEADTAIAEDLRIQNLNFRADAVFEGVVEPEFLVINEIVVSTSGTDTEFLELLGDPMLSLDGVFLLEVTSGGVIDTVFDFSGAALGANGYFLAASPAAESNLAVTADFPFANNTFTNVSQTYLLVRDFTGATGDDIDADNDGAIDAAAWSEIVDSVAVIGADIPVVYSDNVVGPDGTFLAAGGFRSPEGTGAFALHGFSDFAAFSPTAGAVEEEVEVVSALISQVQGAGSASPLDGQRVKVQAVVTLVSNALNGFFLQEEAADHDGEAATSEGVFVFTGSDPMVNVGERIEFEADVSEFFALTQLSGLGEITVLETGVALPEAIAFTLPLPDATDPIAFYESLEGMLVRATAASGETLRVTDAFTNNGEVGVTAGAPLVQPTQAFESFGVDASALEAANARNILLFENPVDDSLTSAPRVGDGIVGGTIDGALTFTFGEYKVETSTPVAFDPSVNPSPRPDAPDAVSGRLKVASFNVLNYFTTLGSRGAATTAELEAQTAKIVAAILAIDADVLGLIEIENDLAGVADEAVAALVAAVNAALGADVYGFVATGKIGTDQIKQALVYKSATVAPTGAFAVLDDAAFTAPFTPGSPQSRPALAQTFTETATGEAFTVSVNHFKSKGSPTGAVVGGEADDNPVEGSAALTRVAAAQALADWIATDPTNSGDADHLTIGDFNAYAMERAIEALEAEGFTNLIGPDGVSFFFNGESGTLDYAFATESLRDQVTGATIWNVNSPEASSIQYDGRDFNAFGDLSPFASSDHDPVIVGLDLDSGGETLTVIAAGTGDATRAPMFEVFVDGVSQGVRTIQNVQTNVALYADGPAYDSFVFALDAAPAESVEIVFFNDRGRRGELEDVNLFVEAIMIGDQRLEADVDGFFTAAFAGLDGAFDRPRQSIYWNGVVTFDDFAVA